MAATRKRKVAVAVAVAEFAVAVVVAVAVAVAVCSMYEDDSSHVFRQGDSHIGVAVGTYVYPVAAMSRIVTCSGRGFTRVTHWPSRWHICVSSEWQQ